MEEARKEEQERLQEEADMEKLKLLREEVINKNDTHL